jgi:cytochrome c biogenesis protein ResB
LSSIADSAALIDLFGEMGIFTAALLFTVFGNATSTEILPTDNVVRGLLGLAAFSGKDVGASYLIPVLWVIGSILIITAMDSIRRNRRIRACLASSQGRS